MAPRRKTPATTPTAPARPGRPRKTDSDPPGSGSASTRLTARQQLILEAIRDAIAEHGYPPTVREICQAVGLASSSSVAHQLKKLEQRGFLKRDPNRPRALEVYLPDGSLDRQSRDTPSFAGVAAEESVAVPLLGRIAAGVPILAEQHIEEVVTLPKHLVGSGEIFLLEVHGDSMVDAAICDGDWVAVRRQQSADSGEIVAALLNDEATVKVLKQVPGQTWLLPRNSLYSPIDGNQASILGKVVAVLRKV